MALTKLGKWLKTYLPSSFMRTEGDVSDSREYLHVPGEEIRMRDDGSENGEAEQIQDPKQTSGLQAAWNISNLIQGEYW